MRMILWWQDSNELSPQCAQGIVLQCEKYMFVRKGKGKGGKKKPQDLPAERTPGKQFRDLSSYTGPSSSTLETGSEMARHPACNSTWSLLAWTVIKLLLTSHAGLCYQSKTRHRQRFKSLKFELFKGKILHDINPGYVAAWGLHPTFFHDRFISSSALSECLTLGQGGTSRKNPEASFLFIQETMKHPRSPLRTWCHARHLEDYRDEWMRSLPFMCENTPWKFLLKCCSEWTSSFHEWVWHPSGRPWEVPAISRLMVALSKGSMLHRVHVRVPSALSVFVEGEKKFEKKTEACVSSSNSISACLLYYSLGIKGPAGVLIYSSSLVVSLETYCICDILKISLQSCHFSMFIICLKLVVYFMFLTQQAITSSQFRESQYTYGSFQAGSLQG